jgi:hypothetical protein
MFFPLSFTQPFLVAGRSTGSLLFQRMTICLTVLSFAIRRPPSTTAPASSSLRISARLSSRNLIASLASFVSQCSKQMSFWEITGAESASLMGMTLQGRARTYSIDRAACFVFIVVSFRPVPSR